MSCTLSSTRTAFKLHTSYCQTAHGLLLNSSWATEQLMGYCQTAPNLPPANRRARAPARKRRSQTAPEHNRALPNSSRALRARPNYFRSRARPVCKYFRAPEIADPTASSPQNRQALKLPNSTLCLETRPVAITEWELTTPSLERAQFFNVDRRRQTELRHGVGHGVVSYMI